MEFIFAIWLRASQKFVIFVFQMLLFEILQALLVVSMVARGHLLLFFSASFALRPAALLLGPQDLAQFILIEIINFQWQLTL